jgi:hypothetical protein
VQLPHSRQRTDSNRTHVEFRHAPARGKIGADAKFWIWRGGATGLNSYFKFMTWSARTGVGGFGLWAGCELLCRRCTVVNRLGMDEAEHREIGFVSPPRLALCFGAIGVLVHLLANGRYGYFRDELFYRDCGRHLGWGHVDQPPLIALLARGSTLLFRDSQFAIRVLPALAAGTELWLTGLIAIAFGGRRSAVVLACFPVLVAPGFLVADSRLTMNAFEPVFWMGSAYLHYRSTLSSRLQPAGEQVMLSWRVWPGTGPARFFEKSLRKEALSPRRRHDLRHPPSAKPRATRRGAHPERFAAGGRDECQSLSF